MQADIKNLALDGDWDSAVELALRKIRDAATPVQIADWLMQAGMTGNKSLEMVIRGVSNCLNPNNREFFKLTEWWVIQKRSGIPLMFELECMFLGLEPHPQLKQRQHKEALKRKADALQAELRRIQMELSGEEIDGAPSRLFSDPGIDEILFDGLES